MMKSVIFLVVDYTIKCTSYTKVASWHKNCIPTDHLKNIATSKKKKKKKKKKKSFIQFLSLFWWEETYDTLQFRTGLWPLCGDMDNRHEFIMVIKKTHPFIPLNKSFSFYSINICWYP